MNATVDVEEIRKGSQIYGKAGVSDTLTSYQRAINQAAFELCSANPVLLKHKGDLLQAARKKVDADGYIYAKKSSRSKVFGTETAAQQSGPAKRARWSAEVRATRIQECQDDLANIDMQLKYAERAREKFANGQQYQSAIGALKEIREMKEKKRDLEKELEGLQRKEAKALNYQKKKVLNKNKQVPTTSTTNTRIDAFLKHSTPNVTGEHEKESHVHVAPDQSTKDSNNPDCVHPSNSQANEEDSFL